MRTPPSFLKRSTRERKTPVVYDALVARGVYLEAIITKEIDV